MKTPIQVNPFVMNRADSNVVGIVSEVIPVVADRECLLFDGPGINGMGGQHTSLAKMRAHAEAGGRFVHRVNSAGSLVEPQFMYPSLPA